MSRAYRRVNPLAIMQVQNRVGGNRNVHFRRAAVKRSRREHAHTHHPRIGHLQPNLRRAETRIKNRQDVIDAALQNLAGICVQPDIGILPDVYGIEIVFINVANDPDVRKIGDGKRIGSGAAPAHRPR